jgi:capsular polysaccharide transport system permease protein
LYFGLIASDRYVSEAKFVLEKSGDDFQTTLSLGSLIGAGGIQSSDALLLKERILSLDMLRALDKELGLRRHYSDGNWDFFYRLPLGATQEDFLDYYRERVELDYDDVSSVLTVRVDAFTPPKARQIARAILRRGEDFVNDIGHRMAEEQVRFVSDQLKLGQEKLRRAKQQIIAFQNAHNLVSPTEQAQSLTGIINELEANLAQRKTELKSQLAFLNSDAPQVVATRADIDALAAQIGSEKTRLVGAGGEKLNDLVAHFEDLQIDLQFATDVYRSSLAALETARVEASRKLKHLVVLESAGLPQEALYPRRLYAAATMLVFLVLLYAIGRLVAATIRDHRD